MRKLLVIISFFILSCNLDCNKKEVVAKEKVQAGLVDSLHQKSCLFTSIIAKNNKTQFGQDDYKALKILLLNNYDSVVYVPKKLLPHYPVVDSLEFRFKLQYIFKGKWVRYNNNVIDYQPLFYSDIIRDSLKPYQGLIYNQPLEIMNRLEVAKYRIKAVFTLKEFQNCQSIESDWFYFEVN